MNKKTVIYFNSSTRYHIVERGNLDAEGVTKILNEAIDYLKKNKRLINAGSHSGSGNPKIIIDEDGIQLITGNGKAENILNCIKKLLSDGVIK